MRKEKTINVKMTKTEYKIVAAMVLAALVKTKREYRVMDAACRTQDVGMVAEGTEEYDAIYEVINDAGAAFLDAGVNEFDFVREEA